MGDAALALSRPIEAHAQPRASLQAKRSSLSLLSADGETRASIERMKRDIELENAAANYTKRMSVLSLSSGEAGEGGQDEGMNVLKSKKDKTTTAMSRQDLWGSTINMSDPHQSQALNFGERPAASPRLARKVKEDPKPVHFKEMDPNVKATGSFSKEDSSSMCSIL